MLTTTEAAELLGVDRSHVRRLILTGKLPATKFGRDWVIQRSDLDAYQRDHPKSKAGRPKKDDADRRDDR